MPNVRAAALLLGTATATVLAGCAGSRLAAEPATGVSLAGVWRLNRTASDDPQKVLDKMRAGAWRRMGARVTASRPPDMVGGAPPAEEPSVAEKPGARSAGRPDPLLQSAMAHVLSAHAARGEFLTVRQSAASFELDYGNTRRSFSPGEHSVVSAEGGVGEQVSGWKGREYVIEIKAQTGPTVTERYGLSADSRHLITRLHVAASELPAVDLTRVYDPADETTPRQLPVSD
jgi:hypothetical protein